MSARRLGGSVLELSPIGLGCMQFSGNRGGAGKLFAATTQERIDQVIGAAIDGGIRWFDTAEMYGNGRSERSLSTALRHADVAPGSVAVATKWRPAARTAGNIARSIDVRLGCLQGYPIDLYQIHMPYGAVSGLRAQLRAMAALVHAGKVRAVGVSNFSAAQMKLAFDTLRHEGVPLASNQVQVSLLHRDIERNGVLAAARELGVNLIAYTPLAGGVLTGRYHRDADRQPISRARRVMYRGVLSRAALRRSAALIDELATLGRQYEVSSAAVALSWLVTYYGDSVLAIPGASRPEQAREAASAMRVTLTRSQSKRLDELSQSAG